MLQNIDSKAPCPICAGIGTSGDRRNSLIVPSDIIFRGEHIVALINSFFIEGCEGHVIIVPAEHHQDIYDMPDEVGGEIFAFSKKVATAMRRTYPGCKGITLRQNNEPAGDQCAFHYHLHVVPRYEDDSYNVPPRTDRREPASVSDRARFADVLRHSLKN